jgi:hypothetical protein
VGVGVGGDSVAVGSNGDCNGDWSGESKGSPLEGAWVAVAVGVGVGKEVGVWLGSTGAVLEGGDRVPGVPSSD